MLAVGRPAGPQPLVELSLADPPVVVGLLGHVLADRRRDNLRMAQGVEPASDKDTGRQQADKHAKDLLRCHVMTPPLPAPLGAPLVSAVRLPDGTGRPSMLN